MKNKITLVAFLAVTAGVFAYTRTHNASPSDLRDAVADNNGEFKTNIPIFEKGSSNIPETKAVAVNDVPKGVPSRPIELVAIPGGKFTMGTDSGEKGFEDAAPAHEVTIKAFELSKTAVTVEQYAECVIKGQCTEPKTGAYCNWAKPGRELHPVNCVDWDQANQYAKFKGGRLPSESEWEYAARSGGRNQKYPWGNSAPTTENAVTNILGGYSGTMPVCSKPAGNTAQGLCDMSGNIWQWVQDKYQDSYKGAPVDGSAFEAAGTRRVLRGGSFDDDGNLFFRAGYHGHSSAPGYRGDTFGFRLARSR